MLTGVTKIMRKKEERWFEFGLVWMVATAAAWLTGLLFGTLLETAGTSIMSTSVSAVIGALIGSAIPGAIQWFFLRPRVRSQAFWLLASWGGWLLGLGLATLAATAVAPVVAGLVGGLACGLLQILALTPAAGKRLRWLVANVIGWALAFAVGAAVSSGPLSMAALMAVATEGLVGMALLALISGVLVVVLFPRHEEKDPRHPVRWSGW
jgi:hypothetical protein